METKTLWQAYSKGHDPQLRDGLLIGNIRLVHHVARQLVRTSRVDVDFEDLVSAGTIGLINAIENFDASTSLPAGWSVDESSGRATRQSFPTEICGFSSAREFSETTTWNDGPCENQQNISDWIMV